RQASQRNSQRNPHHPRTPRWSRQAGSRWSCSVIRTAVTVSSAVIVGLLVQFSGALGSAQEFLRTAVVKSERVRDVLRLVGVERDDDDVPSPAVLIDYSRAHASSSSYTVTGVVEGSASVTGEPVASRPCRTTVSTQPGRSPPTRTRFPMSAAVKAPSAVSRAVIGGSPCQAVGSRTRRSPECLRTGADSRRTCGEVLRPPRDLRRACGCP